MLLTISIFANVYFGISTIPQTASLKQQILEYETTIEGLLRSFDEMNEHYQWAQTEFQRQIAELQNEVTLLKEQLAGCG